MGDGRAGRERRGVGGRQRGAGRRARRGAAGPRGRARRRPALLEQGASGPGAELAAGGIPGPAPLPPPAFTSHPSPSFFLPPSVPRGKACSSPSPGALCPVASRAAVPAAPAPRAGRASDEWAALGAQAPSPVAAGASPVPCRGDRPPPEKNTGFSLLRSRSGWLVPERVCLCGPKRAFKVYFWVLYWDISHKNRDAAGAIGAVVLIQEGCVDHLEEWAWKEHRLAYEGLWVR